MNKEYERITAITDYIRKQTSFKPEIALILGSGLGEFAKKIKAEKIISYSELTDFPISTVPGHEGQFIFGYLDNVPMVVMQGRVHFYEGYKITDVVLPIRVMNRLGAKTLFLTNAAGGINPEFSAGDLMLITDHISSFVPSALIGENIDELGVRFPDMSHIYTPKLQKIVEKVAKRENVDLKKGIYIQLTGPNFETPAEIKMYRTLGADAVGMSTACEAMAASHMKMQVVGMSVISNLAAGMTDTPLTHEEVRETADKIAPIFQNLISEAIKEIYKEIHVKEL